MMIVLDQYDVTFKAPSGEEQIRLRVSKDFSVPNDVTRLVSILLDNGYTDIKIAKWENEYEDRSS
jgi:hypothetical protein